MRTKTLLITAAIGAASLASSMAQVYSVNAVGYINLTMQSGLNPVANHLNAGDNGLNAVLPNVPNGAQVITLEGSNYKVDVFDSGAWLDNTSGDPSLTQVAPGKGFFYYDPQQSSPYTVTFVGEVPQGTALTVPLPSGLRFVAGIVPQSLSLSTANGFPHGTLAAGDIQYIVYNRSTVSYDVYVNDGAGGWLDNDTGDPYDARAEVGLGFFIQHGVGNLNWTRCFNVNTPCP